MFFLFVFFQLQCIHSQLSESREGFDREICYNNGKDDLSGKIGFLEFGAVAPISYTLGLDKLERYAISFLTFNIFS